MADSAVPTQAPRKPAEDRQQRHALCDHDNLTTSSLFAPLSPSSALKRSGHSDSIRSMGHLYTLQRMFMRPHNTSRSGQRLAFRQEAGVAR
jgi:hypothetical protein